MMMVWWRRLGVVMMALSGVDSFAPPTGRFSVAPGHRLIHPQWRQVQVHNYMASTNEDDMSEVETLRSQAAQARLAVERLEASLTLDKISALEQELARLSNEESSEPKRAELAHKIQELAQAMNVDSKIPAASATLVEPSNKSEGEESGKIPITWEIVDTATNGAAANENKEGDVLKLIEELERTMEFGGIKQDDLAVLEAQAELFSLHLPPEKVPANTRNRIVSQGGMVGSKANKEPLPLTQLYASASYLTGLPAPLRDSLARAMGYDQGFQSVTNVPDLVSKIYEKGDCLSPKTLKTVYRVSTLASRPAAAVAAPGATTNINKKEFPDISDLFAPNDFEPDNKAIEIIPPVMKKEGFAPTLSDAQLFAKTIQDVYSSSEEDIIEVNGGYMVRGTNRAKDSTALIDAIDEKLKKKAPQLADKFQASYMVDFVAKTEKEIEELLQGVTVLVSDDEEEQEAFLNQKKEKEESYVLLLTSNDFTPRTNQLVLSLVSGGSLFLAFVYAISTFGTSEAITQQLQDSVAIGNFDVLDKLDNQALYMVGAWVFVQFCHEMGHLAIAWKDKFKSAPPVVLPFIALPFLGCRTDLKTSPKNYSSLFDFALLGPMFGIIASTAMLLLGLQLTATTPADATEFLPSLNVGMLHLSTVGATIVDSFYGGQIMTAPENTLIPLHPFAIAGYTSLMISALELLPFRSTDGGRMSQAMFGRDSHKAINGFVNLALLVSLFTIDQKDIFVGYLLVTLFSQTDLEITCRDESKTVGPLRSIAGVSSWILALTILFPVLVSN